MVYSLCEEQTTKQLRPGAESMLTDALAAFSVFHFTSSSVNRVEALFTELRHLFLCAYLSFLPDALSQTRNSKENGLYLPHNVAFRTDNMILVT